MRGDEAQGRLVDHQQTVEVVFSESGDLSVHVAGKPIRHVVSEECWWRTGSALEGPAQRDRTGHLELDHPVSRTCPDDCVEEGGPAPRQWTISVWRPAAASRRDAQPLPDHVAVQARKLWAERDVVRRHDM